MNAPRLIRYRELEPVPWKNGLGLTREIALVASATNATGFRFRLSRAVIDAQAPFSKYPGVRRWLVLARGGAIELRFDEAIVLAKEGLQIGPNNPWAAAYLIAALAHSGRIVEGHARP